MQHTNCDVFSYHASVGMKVDVYAKLDEILGAGDQGSAHARQIGVLLELMSSSDHGMACVVRSAVLHLCQRAMPLIMPGRLKHCLLSAV